MKKTLSLPAPQRFSNGDVLTLGAFLDQAGVFGSPAWRQSRPWIDAWGRLEKLPWGTKNATIEAEVEDLKKLAAVCSNLTLNGHGGDQRKGQRFFAWVALAAEALPPIEDLGELDDPEPPPHSSAGEDASGISVGVS